MALVGPLWIVACVMAVAGVWKLVRPEPTAASLHGLLPGRRAPHGLVRSLGVLELAVGAVTVIVGGRALPVLVAGAYLGFAFAADRLRQLPGGVSCGCFGQSSSPPTLLHVALNLGSAVVAAMAAAWRAPGLTEAWPELPAAGIAHIVAVAAGSAGVITALTVLADVRAAGGRSEGPARGQVHVFGPVIPMKGRV